MKIEKIDSKIKITAENLKEITFLKHNNFYFNRGQGCWTTPFRNKIISLKKFCNPQEKLILEEMYQNITIRMNNSTQSENMGAINREKLGPLANSFLDFQKAGINMLVSEDRKNSLLADPMGLGKTIQAIGVINVLNLTNVLIVCRANMKLNWAKEIKKWGVPGLSINVIAGKKGNIISGITIINFDILKYYKNQLDNRTFELLIVDEVHFCKNPKAERTKTIFGKKRKDKNGDKVLPIKADRNLFLSGTPIPNRPIEIFPILNFLCPEGFFNKYHFIKKFCGGSKTPFGIDSKGSSNEGMLNALMRQTVMIRREKEKVLSFLPPKLRQIIEIDPDKNSVKLLNEEKNYFDFIYDFNDISEEDFNKIIKSMRPIANPLFEDISNIRLEIALAKVGYVCDVIQELIDNGEKIVCFGWHVEICKKIHEYFSSNSILYTGKPGQDELFQNSKNIRLFVGNILSAGTGLTLTAAGICVFAEIASWVPGDIIQAEDRLQRMDSTGHILTHKNILIKHIVLKDSLDSLMLKKIIEKQESLEKALDTIDVSGFIN